MTDPRRAIDPFSKPPRLSPEGLAPLGIHVGMLELDTDGDVEWLTESDNYASDLHQQMNDGNYVFYCGRSSAGLTPTGIRKAVDDLLGAGTCSEKAAGLRARHVFPHRSVLEKALRNTSNINVSVDEDDKPFRNCYVLIVLHRHRIVLSLSVGSGRKVTKEGLQPHGDWIRRCLSEFKPTICGAFFKRLDRLVREGWSMGPFLMEVRRIIRGHGSFLIGDNYMRVPVDDNTGPTLFLKGVSGEQEAKSIVLRREVGWTELTEDRMVDGELAFAHPNAAKAGLFIWKSRLTGRSTLNIESPSLFPDEADVEKGYPKVRKPDGTPPDVPDIIRRFASLIEAGPITETELAEFLVSEYFTTHGLRQRKKHGWTAYYGGPTRPWIPGVSNPGSFTKPILDNVQFYETGKMIAWVDKQKNLFNTITDLWPLAGEWAPESAWKAVKDWKSDRTERHEASERPGLWTSFPVTLDGFPARLMARRDVPSSEMVWRFVMDDDHRQARAAIFDGLRMRALLSPLVADGDLLAPIFDALAEMNGRPLHKYLSRDSMMAKVESLQAREDSIAADVAATEEAQLRTKRLLFGENGGPFLEGAALKVANDEFNERAADLERMRRKIDDLRQQAVRVLADPTIGGKEHEVVALLKALEAQDDTVARHDLRRMVRDVAVTTSPLEFRGLAGAQIHVAGDLVFAHPSGPLAVPFAGSTEAGPAADKRAETLDAVTALRAGEVDPDRRAPTGYRIHRYIKHLFAISGPCRILDCRDPRLLRVLAAVRLPVADGEDAYLVPTVADLRTDTALVEHFGGPAAFDALLEHIETTFQGPQTEAWLRLDNAAAEVRRLVDFAAGAPPARVRAGDWRKTIAQSHRVHLWDFSGPVPEPYPCAHCGGRGLGLMLFREAQGYICLATTCRRDRAGVRWSPEHYDQFLAQRALYLGAGVTLDLPPTERDLAQPRDPTVKNARRRKYRALESLGGEEKDAIALKCANPSILRRTIALDHQVALDTVRAIARDHQVGHEDQDSKR